MPRAGGNHSSSFAAWTTKLAAARKRHDQEVRAINLEHLPVVVLSLRRAELIRAYGLLFRKPAPSKVVHIAAGILEHKNSAKILSACERAIEAPGRTSELTKAEKKRDGHRRWSARNRERIRVRSRLDRLKPSTAERDLAYRRAHREENLARSRAWWAAKSPEERRQYIRDQWERRKAKIMSDPKLHAAYNAQKRKEVAARMERIKSDPKAWAMAERKRIEKNIRLRPKRLEYYYRAKADPVLRERHREQARRSQQRYQLKQSLKSSGKPEALRKRIMEMLPNGFPPELRGDLCHDLFIALMAGQTTMKKLPTIIKARAAKARKLLAETWKQRSLDDVVRGTERVKLVDILASDHPHF